MTDHIDTRDVPPSNPSKPASLEYVQGVRDALDEIAAGLKLHGNVDPEDIFQARRKFYGGDQEPVPPLPTEPYTVIRVTWEEGLAPDNGADVLLLTHWGAWSVNMHRYKPEQLRALITGWEPLAEPRAVTAKAVLRSLESGKGIYSERLAFIEREFGVTS
jgi:hypothetical protein